MLIIPNNSGQGFLPGRTCPKKGIVIRWLAVRAW
jgi:hypothetical protein